MRTKQVCGVGQQEEDTLLKRIHVVLCMPAHISTDTLVRQWQWLVWKLCVQSNDTLCQLTGSPHSACLGWTVLPAEANENCVAEPHLARRQTLATMGSLTRPPRRERGQYLAPGLLPRMCKQQRILHMETLWWYSCPCSCGPVHISVLLWLHPYSSSKSAPPTHWFIYLHLLGLFVQPVWPSLSGPWLLACWQSLRSRSLVATCSMLLV